MESYREMKQRHQEEINRLPLGFAFSESQYKAKLDEWGITPEEAKAGAVVGIGIGGGFIRASDRELVSSTFSRIAGEEEAAIAADQTGEGFIYEMFLQELDNHEYSYTGRISDALDALSLTPEEINASAALQNGLRKAVKEIAARQDPFDE